MMGFQTRQQFQWQLRTRTIDLGKKTRIMGIVNVTPDSFSDGGRYLSTEHAVAHALHLLDEGADILDIGGESTRPGSSAATGEAISQADEQARVLPVIAAVLQARPDALISVDTYRAATAHAAVHAGAEIVNDVSGGLWETGMFATCAELACGTIVMHTRGLPSAWATQASLPLQAVTDIVLQELQLRLKAAAEAGIARCRTVADPGFGFGKQGEENWALLANFATLAATGLPLLAGLSRKGFLSSRAVGETAQQRDDLTHAAHVAAVLGGAHLLRVHDVRGAVRSAAIADAILACV